MNISHNHRLLFGLALGGFLFLSLLIAVRPAWSVQENNASLPGAVAMTDDERAGLHVFISEGCVACHTQQVRNIDMDKPWGGRPGMASDYAWRTRIDIWRATPSTLGTERTGPDLTEVGKRQASADWQYLHLFNPRTVVKQSIMPAFGWLFTETTSLLPDEKAVNVPPAYRDGLTGTIVPTERGRQLVAYLLSLKQVALPTGSEAPGFIEYTPAKALVAEVAGSVAVAAGPDGAALYATHCQACHQANGEGLKGAFPPLKGSPVVTDANASLMVNVVLQGYDARPEYGAMQAFGDRLTDAEIAAILTFERQSWGNKAPAVPVAFVTAERAALKSKPGV
ncbi:MAG: cbb3-type cytochrome c oxidase subunit II [Spirosoma sp.]|nr:cbb3-type cytochrome c oxidase subunit II [Spirosoma sp.]